MINQILTGLTLVILLVLVIVQPGINSVDTKLYERAFEIDAEAANVCAEIGYAGDEAEADDCFKGVVEDGK